MGGWGGVGDGYSADRDGGKMYRRDDLDRDVVWG